MTPARLVLDTNVLLSALLFHTGRLSWLRGAWRSDRVRPLASRETTLELIRVLACPKFALSAEDRRDLLDDYLPFCETVVVSNPRPPVPVCRDPGERPFLELALAGHADALVSGDADLLALADTFAVPVVSPAALRRRMTGAGEAGP